MLYIYINQYKRLSIVTGTNCEVNFTSYSAYTNQLADKNVSFYSSFNVLSTDISFIKMAFAISQELSSLEFNFSLLVLQTQSACRTFGTLSIGLCCILIEIICNCHCI